eukprot:IDg17478t1
MLLASRRIGSHCRTYIRPSLLIDGDADEIAISPAHCALQDDISNESRATSHLTPTGSHGGDRVQSVLSSPFRLAFVRPHHDGMEHKRATNDCDNAIVRALPQHHQRIVSPAYLWRRHVLDNIECGSSLLVPSSVVRHRQMGAACVTFGSFGIALTAWAWFFSGRNTLLVLLSIVGASVLGPLVST